MKLTLVEIATAVGGRLIVPHIIMDETHGSYAEAAGASDDIHCDDAAVVCQTLATSVTWDSREVVQGSLFVALPGNNVDGHRFISDALSRGAVAALVTYMVPIECPQILVEDTALAFARLAAYWRGKLKGVVIGLTGSTGKTSTKGLVRDVLVWAGSVVATKANQNNELGVPNTILCADIDTDYVVVEMGMRGLGQISDLCDIAHPDWGIITNVGQSHCELLGSRDNIARAKAELFCALPPQGVAFVNTDCDFAAQVVQYGELISRGVQMVTVSTRADGRSIDLGESKVFAANITLDQEGRPSFMLCSQDEMQSLQTAPCTLKMHGLHNVSNACMAAAVGLRAGLSIEQCANALALAQSEEGRQSFKQTKQGMLVIDDAYNANPDSMKAALDTFAALSINGKRVAVLGDMGELGDLSLEAHRSVGRMAAKAGVDTLICAGELARDIAQGAIDAGLPEESVQILENATDALKRVEDTLNPQDAVLVKASHFMGFNRIVEGLME